MRLNKSTGDAIRILIACARSEGALVKVVDLSATLDITMQNVFKIVHILSRAKLTAAVRGRHGGIRLSRSADAIFIGDIVRAMEQTESAPVRGGPAECRWRVGGGRDARARRRARSLHRGARSPLAR